MDLPGVTLEDLPPDPSADRLARLVVMRGGVTTTYTVGQVLDLLIGLAPEGLDTIYELAAASQENTDLIALLNAAIAAKADVATVEALLAEKASLTGSETLTNKTLAAPAINAPSGHFLRGRITGLTLSNNASDAANDIDIATGWAASDGPVPAMMTLASVLTKRLDASWAAGSGNGGLDVGTVADASYHVFLIQRSDTGAVDALMSLSATAPTMPANYDRKRRIGSIVRKLGTILFFSQNGDEFLLSGGGQLTTHAVTATATLQAVGVPTGLKVRAIISGHMLHSTGAALLVTSPDVADQVPDVNGTSTAAANASQYGLFNLIIRTDSQARLRFRGTASLDNTRVLCMGWIDDRGRS